MADKCLGEEEEEDMVLLDLCCGSGLFGLAMADRVKNVIGNAAKIIKSIFPQILIPIPNQSANDLSTIIRDTFLKSLLFRRP